MDDTKRAYRDAEEAAKEAWRNRDGEDVADKIGNLGDDLRKELGNAGDVIRRRSREADDSTRSAREGAVDDPNSEPMDTTRPM